MKRKHLLAAAAIAVCACQAVNAQDYLAYNTAYAVKGDSLRTIEIENVQVVATRANEKTPVAYSQLDKEQISKVNNGQDIPFLLTLTPSVVATSDAGTGIGYTGVRIRGVDATRINVTSNGVPLNDAESHSLYWVNMPDFASSVEDIQVQRGLGTSTNGAGAFGGSINMQTESLSVDPYAEVGLSYGSFNTRKETVKVHTGLMKNRWAFSARLSDIHSDGYIQRASSDMTSYFAQGGYFGRNTVVKFVTFGGKEKTYHAWDGIKLKQLNKDRTYNPCGEIKEVNRDASGLPAFDAYGSLDTRVAGFYDNQHDNYIQNHYQLIVNQQLGYRWTMSATLHYTTGDGYYEEYKNGRTLKEYGLSNFQTCEPDKVDYMKTDDNGDYITDADGNYTVNKSNLVRRKQMVNGFGGAIASFNYTGERLTASIGGAANRYGGEHFGRVIWVKNYVGELAPDHEYYRNKTVKTDANVFARANYNVTNGLNIYADMQYRRIHHRIDGRNDNYDWRDGVEDMQALNVDKTYDFFNPKAGIVYDINTGNKVYGSFSMGHKEPTRNNFTDARFNADPKPERLMDYELGYSFRSRLFTAGVNLYYMDYKDQLVLTGETNDIGEPLSDNVAKSYRAGVELAAGVKISEWLRWDVNATLSRNIIKDYTEYLDDYDAAWNPLYTQTAESLGDVTIAYSPSVIAGSLISFNYKGFGASLQSLYVGSQYVTNSMQDGVRASDGSWELEPLKLDAYFVNNLRLDYSFRTKSLKHINVGVTVNNLFNAEYCSNGWGYSSLIHDSGTTYRYNEMGYFPMATINFLASLTVRF